jgi:hypothetical protein
MRKLLFAAVVGSALAWFLDPESGSRRRESVRNWLAELGVVPPRTTGNTVETREDERKAVPHSLATVR